jgi:hypothetical protein
LEKEIIETEGCKLLLAPVHWQGFQTAE